MTNSTTRTSSAQSCSRSGCSLLSCSSAATPRRRSDLVRGHEVAVRHHLSQNLVVPGWCPSMRKEIDGDHEGAERDRQEIERFQVRRRPGGRPRCRPHVIEL